MKSKWLEYKPEWPSLYHFLQLGNLGGISFGCFSGLRLGRATQKRSRYL